MHYDSWPAGNMISTRRAIVESQRDTQITQTILFLSIMEGQHGGSVADRWDTVSVRTKVLTGWKLLRASGAAAARAVSSP